jgi:1,4-alpha-glucan branching enzyme
VQRLVRDLNALYRSVPALHELDCAPEGFEWIDANDTEQSVISFVRRDASGRGSVVIVCNFTPVVRKGYRVGVPESGFYAESLNTDAERYGGSNVGNYGGLDTDDWPMHGRPFSLGLNLPPFAAVVLRHVGRRTAPGDGGTDDDASATS